MAAPETRLKKNCKTQAKEKYSASGKNKQDKI